MNKTEVINAIELLEANHENLRKLVPYRKQQDIGKRSLPGRVFNAEISFNYNYIFDRNIDEQSLIELNSWGHYLNQSVLIRLYAILQEFEVIPYGKAINEQLPGGAEMRILKKLRHVLAHESGKYRPDYPENKKVAKLMIDQLKINFDLDKEGEFDLSIDTVVRPLFTTAKTYTLNS